MESNNEVKKLVLKILCVIILMTLKTEDFDLDNILIDEKSCKNILVYNISHKTLMSSKLMCIRFDKVN